MHIHNPKTTALIFALDKMVVTGSLVSMGVGIVFYVFGVGLARVLEGWLACAWVGTCCASSSSLFILYVIIK
jgi:hypothetical protein